MAGWLEDRGRARWAERLYERIRPGFEIFWDEARGSYADHLVGGASIDAHGTALTDEVLAACREADAVLLGAVGGPKWETLPGHLRPERALLGIRKELNLYANLRPANWRSSARRFICPSIEQ